MLSGNFMALKFGMRFLGGLHFGTDIFGGLIFAPIQSSPLFEIQSTPPWVQIGSTLHHRLVTARDSTLMKKIWR